MFNTSYLIRLAQTMLSTAKLLWKNKKTSVIISLLSAIFLFVHIIRPSIKIDSISVSLLLIGILPWLGSVFEEIKLPGGSGVKYRSGQEQGVTSKPTSPQTFDRTSDSLTFSSEALKILATLWKYQQPYFQNEPLKRWTFVITPISPDFIHYLSGLVEVLIAGLVSVSPENWQCMLTNQGIEYCRQNQEDLGDQTYRF